MGQTRGGYYARSLGKTHMLQSVGGKFYENSGAYDITSVFRYPVIKGMPAHFFQSQRKIAADFIPYYKEGNTAPARHLWVMFRKNEFD